MHFQLVTMLFVTLYLFFLLGYIKTKSFIWFLSTNMFFSGILLSIDQFTFHLIDVETVFLEVTYQRIGAFYGFILGFALLHGVVLATIIKKLNKKKEAI